VGSHMRRGHALSGESPPRDGPQGRMPDAQRSNVCHHVVEAGRGTIEVFLTAACQKGLPTDGAWPTFGPFFWSAMELACQGPHTLPLVGKHPYFGTNTLSELLHCDGNCAATR